MKILRNQILYVCDYCGKKNLSKRGSEYHENEYCRHADSPHQKAVLQKQIECTHKFTETVYRYIPGEAVQEPNYDQCIDCGKIL